MEENQWLDIEPILWIKICENLRCIDILNLSGTCSFLQDILREKRNKTLKEKNEILLHFRSYNWHILRIREFM